MAGEQGTAGRPWGGRGVVPRPVLAFARAAAGGSKGVGRAYADGHWDVADLVWLLRRLHRGLRPYRYLASRWANLIEAGHPVRQASRTPASDRANIVHHYDLPVEWFALFLGSDLSYSCALYDAPGTTLDQASERKLDVVCDRLALGAGSHLLDIGCGWGALALHAAERRGARVTATTISPYQCDHVVEQVRERALGDQVDVRCDHYVDVDGRYDAVASIEMIEAIGWDRQGHFMQRCRDLLRPQGRLFVQAITIDDFHYHRVKRNDDFIKRFIFPGGSLPAARSLVEAARDAGLVVVSTARIGEHYVRTLQDWRVNLERHWDEGLALGFPERELRLWRFYFAYCEAGFAEGYLDDHQVVLRRA